MSQGILQSIYEYQSLICRLTGMDVSNASHYDGATAAAEACLMFADGKRNKVLVSSLIKPDVKRVMSTYFEGRGIKLVTLESFAASINMERLNAELNDEVLAVYVEQPNFYGTIEDMNTISHLVHSVGAKLVAGVYPISLGLLKKPSEYDADAVVGEAQCLGLPLSFALKNSSLYLTPIPALASANCR